jgi:ribosome recycling factor
VFQRRFEILISYSLQDVKKSTNDKMLKAAESIQSQFNTLRAGGANPTLLDRIMVDYYGTSTPLNQLARFVFITITTIA